MDYLWRFGPTTCAVRNSGYPQPLVPQRLVDESRDSASAHSSRKAPAERSARTDASHSQAAGDPAGCSNLRRSTEIVRCIPHRVQHRRPHEWLNQDTPASHYVESPRPYPTRLLPLEYPGHFVVKKVTTGGTFRFQHKLLYIANSLVDHRIGLKETDDGIWSIYFNTVLIATLDELDYIIRG